MKRNFFKISFIACLILSALIPASTAMEIQAPPSSFSFLNLQNGEKLVVSRSYQGCFSGGPRPTLTFTNRGVDVEETGQFDLSISELTRLDNYYTLVTKPDNHGGCTTSQNYVFELTRPGKDTLTFRGSDSFCGHYLPLSAQDYLDENKRKKYNQRISNKFFTFSDIEARAEQLYGETE